MLVGIGVYSLVTSVPPGGADLAWVLAGAAAGLLLGALRGLTPRLFVRHGHLWQRYTGWTLLAWVVSVAINASLGAMATAAGTLGQARPTTLSIGVGLLGEAMTPGPARPRHRRSLRPGGGGLPTRQPDPPAPLTGCCAAGLAGAAFVLTTSAARRDTGNGGKDAAKCRSASRRHR